MVSYNFYFWVTLIVETEGKLQTIQTKFSHQAAYVKQQPITETH